MLWDGFTLRSFDAPLQFVEEVMDDHKHKAWTSKDSDIAVSGEEASLWTSDGQEGPRHVLVLTPQSGHVSTDHHRGVRRFPHVVVRIE
jgi:hypothetical protein